MHMIQQPKIYSDCSKPSYLGNEVFLCLYVTSKLCLKVVKNSRQEEYCLYKTFYNYLHLCILWNI